MYLHFFRAFKYLFKANVAYYNHYNLRTGTVEQDLDS